MGNREWGIGNREQEKYFPYPHSHSPFPIFLSDGEVLK
jgi:hypothetical protein